MEREAIVRFLAVLVLMNVVAISVALGGRRWSRPRPHWMLSLTERVEPRSGLSSSPELRAIFALGAVNLVLAGLAVAVIVWSGADSSIP